MKKFLTIGGAFLAGMFANSKTGKDLMSWTKSFVTAQVSKLTGDKEDPEVEETDKEETDK